MVYSRAILAWCQMTLAVYTDLEHAAKALPAGEGAPPEQTF